MLSFMNQMLVLTYLYLILTENNVQFDCGGGWNLELVVVSDTGDLSVSILGPELGQHEHTGHLTAHTHGLVTLDQSEHSIKIG